ncbi:hypothetical protein BGZ92_002826 [Podila epicladia]|nr:hypothetical protein BGZ92_002826 [Podila epicladia]
MEFVVTGNEDEKAGRLKAMFIGELDLQCLTHDSIEDSIEFDDVIQELSSITCAKTNANNRAIHVVIESDSRYPGALQLQGQLHTVTVIPADESHG